MLKIAIWPVHKSKIVPKIDEGLILSTKSKKAKGREMFGMHCCFIRFFITSFTCSKVKVYCIPNRAYDEEIPDGKLIIKANRKGIFDHLRSEKCEKLKRKGREGV